MGPICTHEQKPKLSHFLAGAALLSITSCETIRVQGYEIDRDTQIAVAVAGIVAGTFLFLLTDDDDSAAAGSVNKDSLCIRRQGLKDGSTGRCLEYATIFLQPEQ
ncbi:MAG: hypothetical protein AAGF20_00010 [Pseudomonadota bacterium]